METIQNNTTIHQLEAELKIRGISLKNFYDELIDMKNKFKIAKNEEMFHLASKFLQAIENYKHQYKHNFCIQGTAMFF